MTTLRNSSIELLRIVCMLFIVFHHYMVHMAFPEYNISAWGLGDGALSVAMLLNGFFCVAVNCFVLISGYYGIHFKLRGLFKLYITCAFYGLIGYFVHLYVDGAHIGRSILDDSLFAFSNSKWWFINCYIQLFVMAPFLNVAIEHLEKKKYLYVLLLFSFLNVYLGYIGMGKYFNQYGYSTAQMVYLYLIGAYLKKYVPMNWFQRKSSTCFVVYLVFSILIGCQEIVNHFCVHGYHDAFSYNNPLVLVSSVALFSYFLSHSYYCKSINWISSGVLAAYLIPEQYRIGFSWLYPNLNDLFVHCLSRFAVESVSIQVFVVFVSLMLISIVTVACCVGIDYVRAWMSKPLWKLYEMTEKKLKPLLYEYSYYFRY